MKSGRTGGDSSRMLRKAGTPQIEPSATATRYAAVHYGGLLESRYAIDNRVVTL